jgi:hypothetical protein
MAAAKTLTEVIAKLEASIAEARRRISDVHAPGYQVAVGYLDALTEMRDWLVGA